MKSVCPTSFQQKGLTLIEIMIALLLGAFILGGVMQVFISTKQTYRVQEALSRLQENGRFAIDVMGRDIRMADYRSCTSSRPPSADATLGITNGIVGTNGAQNTNRAKDLPDDITVVWSDNSCNVAAPTPSNRYYGITSAKLYQGVSEIVEGVENLQITYGVDSDGDSTPNYYGSAGAVTLAQMAQVISVRVSLLLRTLDDNIAAQPLQYTYNGATALATDRRIRRVFNATFFLRNRSRG